MTSPAQKVVSQVVQNLNFFLTYNQNRYCILSREDLNRIDQHVYSQLNQLFQQNAHYFKRALNDNELSVLAGTCNHQRPFNFITGEGPTFSNLTAIYYSGTKVYKMRALLGWLPPLFAPPEEPPAMFYVAQLPSPETVRQTFVDVMNLDLKT